MMTLKESSPARVCVYCGSSFGASPLYRKAAAELGRLLASRRITLVFGGARRGLMGVLAEATLVHGGHVVGVLPRLLRDRGFEPAMASGRYEPSDGPSFSGQLEIEVVETMHERKARMAALSDAFIALPGGIGTLDELFEVWTWTQLGSHAKPVGLLDVGGFYEKLTSFLEHLEAEQFLKPAHRAILQVAEHPAALLDLLAAWRPTHEPK